MLLITLFYFVQVSGKFAINQTMSNEPHRPKNAVVLKRLRSNTCTSVHNVTIGHDHGQG